MIPIIKILGFVVICLLAYIIMYEHCVNKVPFANYGHENEMYNVGVEVKEVECL